MNSIKSFKQHSPPFYFLPAASHKLLVNLDIFFPTSRQFLLDPYQIQLFEHLVDQPYKKGPQITICFLQWTYSTEIINEIESAEDVWNLFGVRSENVS